MKIVSLALTLAACCLAQSSFHEDAFVMDAHVHVMSRQLLEGLDIGDRLADGHVDLPRLKEGGLDAVFFSVYTPEAYYPARHEVKNTFRVVSLAVEQIEKNSDAIELALTAPDVERIARSGKIAAFLDLEGPFDIDGDLHILRALYRLGLRSAQLTAHNYTNNFADSCCDVPKWDGLNDHGRAVVREMNRLGMIINVAHGSNETILQTVAASEDPVIYTHGGFRHFANITRCISDEAAKAVASKGGVIALQFGNSFNNPKYFRWRFNGPLVADISKKLGRYKEMSIEEVDRGARRAHGAFEEFGVDLVHGRFLNLDVRHKNNHFENVLKRRAGGFQTLFVLFEDCACLLLDGAAEITRGHPGESGGEDQIADPQSGRCLFDLAASGLGRNGKR